MPSSQPHKLLLLSKEDNVLVALGSICPGQTAVSDGSVIEVLESVMLGQKVARIDIAKGQKIIKYGVSIGSASCDILVGYHAHVHNMQSDYTPTYILKETAGGSDV